MRHIFQIICLNKIYINFLGKHVIFICKYMGQVSGLNKQFAAIQGQSMSLHINYNDPELFNNTDHTLTPVVECLLFTASNRTMIII